MKPTAATKKRILGRCPMIGIELTPGIAWVMLALVQKLLKPKSALVYTGNLASGPPRSFSILPILGMMKIINPKKARIVIDKMTVGYVMAPFIFLRMVASFS